MNSTVRIMRQALAENDFEKWEQILNFSMGLYPLLALEEAKQATLNPLHQRFEEAAVRCWGMVIALMVKNNFPHVDREIRIAWETSKPDSALEAAAIIQMRAFKTAKREQAAAKADLRAQAGQGRRFKDVGRAYSN